MPLRVKTAPRPPPTRRTPANRTTAPNRAVAGTGFGSSLLNAGTQIGTAAIAARAAQDTLNKLTQNPLLLAAVAGVALVYLLR